MSALALDSPVVSYDPLRDSRHRSARSAREQADWLAWLELGGTAARTLSDYEWATARALRMFPQKALVELTDGDLAHVLRTFPARSRRTKKAAYDSWFRWARKTGRIEANPMERLPSIAREGQKVIDVFSDAEIAALTSLPPVDATPMLILFEAGLRRSEARHLRVRDFRADPMPGQLIILNAKGRKDRLIPMTRRLAAAVAEFTLLEGLGPNHHFWYSRPGGHHVRRDRPIGETSFLVWWRRCLQQAGVRYRNPHVSRHTFATRWLRRGGRLHTLSLVMGHSSIRVTADFYSHLDTSDIQKDMDAMEALNA